jgi:hypothetical protein
LISLAFPVTERRTPGEQSISKYVEGEAKMDEAGQPAIEVTRDDQEQRNLLAFAERVADGWAEQLAVGKGAVEWVAVRGGRRTPLPDAGADAAVHRLEGGRGIAFVLGSPGVMDLLFVVTPKKVAFSVNISNNARPADRGERHDVRHGYVGDVKGLLVSAERYARTTTPET